MLLHFTLALCVTALALGCFQICRALPRGAIDVLHDLTGDGDVSRAEGKNESARRYGVSAAEAKKERIVILIVIPSLLFVVRALVAPLSISSIVLFAAIVFPLNILIMEGRKRRQKLRAVREFEFYLPVVMERIVMAAQAGHDILAAIKALIDMDGAEKSDQKQHDPVTAKLATVYRMAESGSGLEESLAEVARGVDCPAVRHAFVHLAQAHKEGGELVMPLRELSDSTQLYYQESVEEEIAKMPVKATLPLLCTFAGLIIFFLTAPLMQVMDITTKALPR